MRASGYHPAKPRTSLVKRKKQNNLLGDELQRTGASCKNVMDMIWYSTVHLAPDASMLRVRGGWGGCECAQWSS